jgi:hypothetical protein
MVAMPGTDWHDVMTYCNRQWLSAYTYEGIRARLAAEDAMSAGPLPPPGSGPGGAGRPDARYPDEGMIDQGPKTRHNLIHVAATVNLTARQGKIKYVHPLTQGEATPASQDSPVVLQTETADGLVRGEFHVGVKIFSDMSLEDGSQGLVDASLSVESDVRTIKLLVNGKVVDVFKASHTPPGIANLRLMSPYGLDLGWDKPSGTADNQTYTVQVSTDQGKTWQTFAIGLREPGIKIDQKQFAESQRVLVRVIATDGFTQSIVTSRTLRTRMASQDFDLTTQTETPSPSESET